MAKIIKVFKAVGTHKYEYPSYSQSFENVAKFKKRHSFCSPWVMLTILWEAWRDNTKYYGEEGSAEHNSVHFWKKKNCE